MQAGNSVNPVGGIPRGTDRVELALDGFGMNDTVWETIHAGIQAGGCSVCPVGQAAAFVAKTLGDFGYATRRRSFRHFRQICPAVPLGRLSGFPCKGRFRYANLNLPSNMIANCAFAMAHSRGGILHSFWARFNTRKRSFSALSSVGKWPRARTALRNLAFNDSIAFVV